MRRMGKKSKMLTPRQYATMKGVAYTTVMNWLQQGKIPEAIKHQTPTGHYWEIPEKVPAPKLLPGRPPNPTPATNGQAAKAKPARKRKKTK